MSKASSVTYLNDAAPASQCTYIVIGSPRGGTSMVAGLLRLLGIYMGDEVAEANNEDQAFINLHKGGFETLLALTSKDSTIKTIRDIIQERNKKHETWGWKDPLSSLYVKHIIGDLRNPRFVFVTRDLAAIAQREQLAMASRTTGSPQEFFLRRMQRSLTLYEHAIEDLLAHKFPSAVVSYERALIDPADCSRRLLRFAGLNDADNDDLLNRMATFISPNRNTGSLNYVVPNQSLQATAEESQLKRQAQAEAKRRRFEPLQTWIAEMKEAANKGSVEDVGLAKLAQRAARASGRGEFDEAKAMIGKIFKMLEGVGQQFEDAINPIVMNHSIIDGRLGIKAVPQMLAYASALAGELAVKENRHAVAKLYLDFAVAALEENREDANYALASEMSYLRARYFLAVAMQGVGMRALSRKTLLDLSQDIAANKGRSMTGYADKNVEWVMARIDKRLAGKPEDKGASAARA